MIATPDGEAPPKLTPDRDAIRLALEILVGPDRCFEIRAILKGFGARSEICHTLDEGVAAALHFKNSKGTYFTLNALRDDVDGAAKDADVILRINLLIDVDAVRAAGAPAACNATDLEKAAALALARSIRDFLGTRGWPAPALIDSGNGAHLVYRIELPNDAAATALVKAVLEELARRFDNEKARVDTSVFNASRISKLPGTVVRKGDDSPDRPQRIARMIEPPSPGEVVTGALLEALVAEAPREATAAEPAARAARVPRMATSGRGHRRAAGIVAKFGAATAGGLHYAMRDAAWALTGLVNEGDLTMPEAERYYAETAARNGSDGDHCRENNAESWRSAANKPHKADDPYPSGPVHGRAPGANGHPAGSATVAPTATSYESLTEDQLGVEWAEAIEDEPIEWINEGRLAAGKLHILAGAGGLGKSQHMIALAAAVSTGGTFPDGGKCLKSGVVLILAAEDGRADTIKPRLVAAGADTKKVAIIKTTLVIPGKDGKPPMIDLVNFQHLPYWEAVFKKLHPTLLIADPVPAFLGPGINDHRNADVRQVLEPFVELLGRYAVAMEAGTHVGKAIKDKSATDQILGSVAYGNLARRINITWLDPDTPGRYIVTNPKLSVGPKQPALAYTIEPVQYESRGKVISTSRLKFEEQTFQADEYELAQGQKDAHRGRRRGPDPTRMNELVGFLFAFMKGKGPVLLGELAEAAGNAQLIGSREWDEKKGRHKWSNFSALYEAAERLAELPPPDNGWVVVTSKADPTLRSTTGHVRWLLRRDDPAS